MASARIAESSNRILTALSAQSRCRLWPVMSRTHVQRGHRLYEPGAKIAKLYFVESGLVSLVKPMNGDRSVAFGAVGPEGIVPATAVFGLDHTIMESVVLIPSTVLSIDVEEFQACLGHDWELTRLMQRYVSALLNCFAQTAACNVLHSVVARCARWLLVAHDSVVTDTFLLTHDFLANVLGVRRESVSIAAKALQDSGSIQYRHGKVVAPDHRKLERAACECYVTVGQLFDEVFGRIDIKN